jgi:hypothetical protein
MVESEMSCNRSALQVIREIALCDVNKIKRVSADEKIDWHDPFVFAALAKKMIQICEEKSLPFLHAMMCGLNLNFFIMEKNQTHKIFSNCQYAKTGEIGPCIEHNYYEMKKDGKYKTYYTMRAYSVVIVGMELVNLNNPEFKELEIQCDGQEAIMIQQAVDLQNCTFLEDLGVEVETF